MANSFCGPYVISHALDIPIKDACAKIREITGKRAVFGVNANVMDALFDRVFTATGRTTVLEFSLSHHTGVYVLNIRGHYLILDGERTDHYYFDLLKEDFLAA